MLAYRNPSNEDSDSIFNYTLKLDAYDRMKSFVNTASKLSGDTGVKEACQARSMYQLDINTYEHRLQKKDKIIEEQNEQIQEQKVQLEEKDKKYIEEKRLKEQEEQLLLEAKLQEDETSSEEIVSDETETSETIVENFDSVEISDEPEVIQ